MGYLKKAPGRTIERVDSNFESNTGLGPWWCPQCRRATITYYRCSNYDCEADLAGVELDVVNQ